MRSIILHLTASAAAALSTAYAADPPASAPVLGDAVRGKVLYQACLACHSVEDNDLGPRHRGVVGRHAGSVADYNYSPALKNSGITWDPRTLDRWLTNPSALVPGTKMFFKIDDAKGRADIIAYLEELK
jgi:cytochrome c